MYSTVDELEEYTGKSFENSRAESTIKYVSKFIDSYTGRIFSSVSDVSEETRKYHVYGGTIFVDDLAEVTKVEAKQSRGDDYIELEEDDDYDIFPLNAGNKEPITSIMLFDNYYRGRVTGKFTYAQETPKDIVLATIELADVMLSGATDKRAVKSRKMADFSISYDSGRTMDVERILMLLSTYKKQEV